MIILTPLLEGTAMKDMNMPPSFLRIKKAVLMHTCRYKIYYQKITVPFPYYYYKALHKQLSSLDHHYSIQLVQLELALLYDGNISNFIMQVATIE